MFSIKKVIYHQSGGMIIICISKELSTDSECKNVMRKPLHYKEDARAVKPVETKWQHKRFMMLYGGKKNHRQGWLIERILMCGTNPSSFHHHPEHDFQILLLFLPLHVHISLFHHLLNISLFTSSVPAGYTAKLIKMGQGKSHSVQPASVMCRFCLLTEMFKCFGSRLIIYSKGSRAQLWNLGEKTKSCFK